MIVSITFDSSHRIETVGAKLIDAILSKIMIDSDRIVNCDEASSLQQINRVVSFKTEEELFATTNLKNRPPGAGGGDHDI